MKIGIDIKSAFEAKRSGVGNYVYHLVKNILSIDSKNEYSLFSSSNKNEDFIPQNANAKIINRKSISSLLKKMDVLHGPDFKLLPIRANKKIVTIHDLASFMDEDFMSDDFKKLTQRKIIKSIGQADIIVTVSNSVKEQLINQLKLSKEKIQVVYHGVSEINTSVINKERNENILTKLGIAKPFFLFVGNIETRKNIITLLKAFEIFKDKYKTEHELVLVGKSGHGYEKIQEALEANKVKSDIKEIGWIEDDDLAVLYSEAEIFIFPSLYEGFGMPLLEAMKFKLPIICSSIEVLKEIASDSALFVNPSDPNDIAESIYEAVSNNELKKRLIQNGIERVKNFSWEKTARIMLNIYES